MTSFSKSYVCSALEGEAKFWITLYMCYLYNNILITIFIFVIRALGQSERARKPGQSKQKRSGLGTDYLVIIIIITHGCYCLHGPPEGLGNTLETSFVGVILFRVIHERS